MMLRSTTRLVCRSSSAIKCARTPFRMSNAVQSKCFSNFNNSAIVRRATAMPCAPAALAANSLATRAVMARFYAAEASTTEPAASPRSYLDKAEVTERILRVVKNFEKVDPAKVTPTSRFSNDLNLDSLDQVEIVLAIEQEFAMEIPDKEAEKILSVEDAITYICESPLAK